jgi:tetratricopeptide (TPR) repeat protein
MPLRKTVSLAREDLDEKLREIAARHLLAEGMSVGHQSRGDRKELFDPEHPGVAIILHDLAALYADQGRYAEAEPLYRRALAINERVLGPEAPILKRKPETRSLCGFNLFVRGHWQFRRRSAKSWHAGPRGLQPRDTSLIENKRSYNDLGGSYEVSSAS